MISLVVVALVGIGFTRLTMLALELRDNFDDADGDEPADMGRKRIEAHNKMRHASKPEFLILKQNNRFEACSKFRSGEAMFPETGATIAAGLSLFSNAVEVKAVPADDAAKAANASAEAAADAADVESPKTPLDPTDTCTICFEKAKNAVILHCGHGGMCYNCCIDVLVTSGHCPFCRKEMQQIVTIGLGSVKTDGADKIITVIGPK